MEDKKRFSMIHETFEDWLKEHMYLMDIETIEREFESESSGCAGAPVLLRTDRFRWLVASHKAMLKLESQLAACRKERDDAQSHRAQLIETVNRLKTEYATDAFRPDKTIRAELKQTKEALSHRYAVIKRLREALDRIANGKVPMPLTDVAMMFRTIAKQALQSEDK